MIPNHIWRQILPFVDRSNHTYLKVSQILSAPRYYSALNAYAAACLFSSDRILINIDPDDLQVPLWSGRLKTDWIARVPWRPWEEQYLDPTVLLTGRCAIGYSQQEGPASIRGDYRLRGTVTIYGCYANRLTTSSSTPHNSVTVDVGYGGDFRFRDLYISKLTAWCKSITVTDCTVKDMGYMIVATFTATRTVFSPYDSANTHFITKLDTIVTLTRCHFHAGLHIYARTLSMVGTLVQSGSINCDNLIMIDTTVLQSNRLVCRVNRVIITTYNNNLPVCFMGSYPTEVLIIGDYGGSIPVAMTKVMIREWLQDRFALPDALTYLMDQEGSAFRLPSG